MATFEIPVFLLLKN